MNEREQTSRVRTGAFCLARDAVNDNAEPSAATLVAPSLVGLALARDAHVAVMPHSRVKGVGGGVDAHSFTSWSSVDPFELDARERAHHSPLEVVSLLEAFERRWSTDAHMVSGVLALPSGDPSQRQPRVNTGAYDDLFSRGYRLRFQVVFVDSDRNDKRDPWTDEARAYAQRVLDEAPELEGCVWHFTRGGLHILGALASPTEEPRTFESMLRAFQSRVAPALARIPTPPTASHPAPYMMPDRTCSQWTRLLRLPRVQREAKAGAPLPAREEQPFDLSRLRPLSLEVDAANVAARASALYRPGTFGTFGADYDREVPSEWAPHIEALGRACASGRDAIDSADSWNALFNALAGALCDGGVALRTVPAIIGAVASAAGDDGERRVRECGVDTARKYSQALPVTKTPWLETHRPDVGRELARVLGLLQLGATGALPTASEVWERARAWVRTRPLAPCVLKLGTGIGKTELAIDCAREAAVIGRDEHGRAKGGAKTGITVPTHKLAIEVAERARRVGLPVVRMFSPPTLMNSDDTPVCKLFERARVIADAGLSVPYELCQGRGIAPCEHREGCAAADGEEGDAESALVFIGTHERLPAIASAVGSRGTVFVDEPPDTVREHSIALATLEALADDGESGRGIFTPSYADALGAVVAALLAAARDTARWTRTDGGELVQRLWPVADVVSPEALARFAAVEAKHGPPLRGVIAGFMRSSDGEAAALVARCSLAALLHRIAARPWMNDAPDGSRAPRWTTSVPVDRHTGELAPSLVFTGAPAHLEDSLAAMPRAVFMDASPDVEALSRAVGATFTASQVFEGLACDAVRVTRTVIRCCASRTRLVNGGEPVVEEVAGVLQRAIAWALEEPTASGLALFSYLPVIAAVDLAAGIDSTNARALSPAVAAEVRELLSPVIARWLDGGRRTLMTGHYGALRGRDGFKGNDAFVTIGDAQSNLDAVGRVARHLGTESSARGEWLAARELEQAHGRARFPRRTKPARALHIGNLWPLGAGWDRAEWRVATGRVETLSPAEAAEAVEVHGSQREAARALGRPLSTLQDALARGEARGDRKGGREDNPPTTPFPVGRPAGIETQSAAQNTRRSDENAVPVTGVVSGRIWDRPVAARAGRPPIATAARMEASAMDVDEFELALVKLCRRLGKNRAEVAEVLGVSRKSLERYASGKRPISADLAAKVRELLSVAA